jgi:hypothetical protein
MPLSNKYSVGTKLIGTLEASRRKLTLLVKEPDDAFLSRAFGRDRLSLKERDADVYLRLIYAAVEILDIDDSAVDPEEEDGPEMSEIVVGDDPPLVLDRDHPYLEYGDFPACFEDLTEVK